MIYSTYIHNYGVVMGSPAFIIIIIIAVIVAVAVKQKKDKENDFKLIQSERNKQDSGVHSPQFDTNHVNQIAEIQNSDIHPQALLGMGERDIFYKIHSYLRQFGNKYFVHAQVSLGEIIAGNQSVYLKYVNSKRVDFCVVDNTFNPVCVIEYQGSGHYGQGAVKRDEIKKVACETAGIKYITLYKDSNVPEILDMHFGGLKQIS